MTNYKSGIASKWISSISEKYDHAIDNKNLISSIVKNTNIEKLEKGERIFHQKFGYGKVLHVDGEKVEIKFEKSDTKKVLMSFIEKLN